MRVDDLTVEVRAGDLSRIGQLKDTDLTDLLVVPCKNDVGSWALTLPAYELDADGNLIEHELCRALRTPQAGLIITGPGGVILSGPMTSAVYSAESADPNGSWEIVGISDAVILQDALAWGDPTVFDLSSQTTANDTQSGAAESLMYRYVRRNLGDLAVLQRRNARLTCAADQARGPIVQYSPRFQNLMGLLQKIATGTDLVFDVRQAGYSLQFVVELAADLTSSIRLDIENDQLSKTRASISVADVTDVIVAGQGEGTERQMIRRTSSESAAAAALWGRRIERFVDQRQTSDLNELQQAGDDELANGGSTVTAIEIVPNSDLAGLTYGVDWQVGARVTVVVGSDELSAITTEAPIKISRDGVFVGATIGSTSGFDWESVIESRQSSIESRVANLEQSDSGGSVGAIDGGTPSSIYGGFAAIDGGGV